MASNHHPLKGCDNLVAKNDGIEIDNVQREPIAIIGFSFKFPGGMTTDESLWQAIANRKSAMSDFPKDRLNQENFYDPDRTRVNGFPIRGAHFLDDQIAAFDAPFFSISPAEAEEMDPQQRGLLEASYRALQLSKVVSGIPIEQASGSNTAVYTGSFADDYKALFHKDPENQAQYSASGMAPNMLANRISWFYNFSGTSLNLDTACSSSLVAVHLACQGLLNLESNMALVAGSSLIFNPDLITALNNQNFLSPDGRCFSFDHRANGYARGEGIAVIVLKRLSDALSDNDTVRAVIRGTGSNQDGRTPGITQPSKSAQEKVILDTYAKAGLGLDQTRYFEAHGTGTPVGDPIEAGAIGATFGKYRSSEEPLYCGSIKANIGHLEGASGIAGLIKSIVMIERGMIPPNAGFERLNPDIKADEWNLKFPEELIPWPANGIRRVSVNSFGFGGTNAHAILDDTESYLKLHRPQFNPFTAAASTRDNGVNGKVFRGSSSLILYPESGSCTEEEGQLLSEKKLELKTITLPETVLLIFSAADERGLQRIESLYRDYLSTVERNDSLGSFLKDLADTLNERRSSLLWKSYATLNTLPDSTLDSLKLSKPVRASTEPELCFIFTGQGAQWSAMGRELFIFDSFVNDLIYMDKYLATLGCRWSLLSELTRDKADSNVDHPQFSQPLCTAIQIALVNLLRNFELHPACVIGHSSGEIAAAYCTGALDCYSALKVAYFRGLLVDRVAKNSPKAMAMLSVGLSEHDILPYIQRVEETTGEVGMSVGCINSPTNVTITGLESMITVLKMLLDEQNIFARKLAVNIAYHSQYLEPMVNDYLQLVGNVSSYHINRPTKMISSVTAEIVGERDLCQVAYWVRNLISPVRFSAALTAACAPSTKACKKDETGRQNTRLDFLLEIGPHSALQVPIKQILVSLAITKPPKYTSVLVRSVPAISTLLEALGTLYCNGHSMSLSKINQKSSAFDKACKVLTNLPEYPFDHSRSFWRESRISAGHRFRKQPYNHFLGAPVPDWNPMEARWRRKIKLTESQWLEDHKASHLLIHGMVLFPAAAMLVMAIEAVRQISGGNEGNIIAGYTFKDVAFHTPLSLVKDSNGVEVEFHLRPLQQAADRETTWSEFRLYAFDRQECSEICRGCIRAEFDKNDTEVANGLERVEHIGRYRRIFQEGKTACQKRMDTEKSYRIFDEVGLGFGPTFQTVKVGTYNTSAEAFGEISLHEWLLKDFNRNQQPNVIHPTALDGLLQLSFLALSEGGAKSISSLVPRRIKRLWISSAGLNGSGSTTIKAYNKSNAKSVREATSTVVAFDSSEKDLRIVLEGYDKIALGNHDESGTESQNDRTVCFNIDSRADIDLLNDESFSIYSRSVSQPKSTPISFFQDLKLAMSLFIKNALSVMEQKDQNLMQPHHQQYVRWMRHECEKMDTEGALLSQWREHANNPTFLERLCSSLEENKDNYMQGKFHTEVGRNIIKILCGEVDPLELFFKTGLVKGYYHEFNKTTNGLNYFLVYLDALVHKRPRLKILEIGAGTGGVTKSVLETITKHSDHKSHSPRFSHYTYTDISPSFFENGRLLFEGLEHKVTFKILDIEKEPSEQGFEAGSFDLIIADNVFHATRDLDVTMSNARKLLKPDGIIALMELTKPETMKTNFAFGLLPGWWHFTDNYRYLSAGVNKESWNQILIKAGFSGIKFEFPDFYDKEYHEHSVLISTAVDITISKPETPQVLILTNANSGFEYEVALELVREFASIGVSSTTILPLEEGLMLEDTDKMLCITLFEAYNPILKVLSPEKFQAIRDFLSRANHMLWITRGGGRGCEEPEYALINGLARTIRQERTRMKFITLAFQPAVSTASHFAKTIKDVHMITWGLSADDYEPEYVERDGILYVDRLVEAAQLNRHIDFQLAILNRHKGEFGAGEPLKLTMSSPGLLDTLEFIEDKEPKEPLKFDEVEIEVRATGVNFRDCLIALGRIPGNTFGFECAGIVKSLGSHCGSLKIGDRVCSSAAGTFQTYARCKALHTRVIPESTSFAEGAALPVAFQTAYYALVYVARIQQGESILIHSAAGGTGQAAVQIAKLFNAEIYATVSSDEKKMLLMELYGIPGDHIFYSRDDSFVRGIMRMTRSNGGVDVVLNSLSGDALVNTWECIAPFGRFLEIGKKDIMSNGPLPMGPFLKNVSFHAIDLNEARISRPRLLSDVGKEISAWLFSKKICPPQPLHIYGVGEIEQSFRYLQSGKNTGKTVVELRGTDIVKTVSIIKQRWHFEQNSTYVIAGGLGGIGRSISRWMVLRGAKHLILLSRSGPSTELARTFVQELREQGAHIETPICDISQTTPLLQVISELSLRMPPIKGCIQSSMVLKDSIFEQMSHDNWVKALQPKLNGSTNLHYALPKGMDFFIMLSSIAGAIGSTTQANYASGCAYQDALAHHRVGLGEKATTLNLGMMTDDGVLTENTKMMNIMKSTGYLLGIGQKELYALLEHYCDPSMMISTPLTTQVVIGFDVPASLEAKGIHLPTFMRRPLFSSLYNVGTVPVEKNTSTEGSEVSIANHLAAANTLDEAADIICNALKAKLSNALAIPLENLDSGKTLYMYGVDSLVAVELRNWISQTVDADVAIFEILGNTNFEDIAILVARNSRVVQSILGHKSSSE